MTKIMITGTSGQLGRQLAHDCRGGGHHCGIEDAELILLSHKYLDIAQNDKVKKAMEHYRPDVVINCAAMTNVDDCERFPEEAFRANAKGPENLAAACCEGGSHLIHISTDYVFSGKKGSPYLETDTPDPINVYGKSKREGEKCVLALCSNSAVVRVSWLYGQFGKNFVSTVLDKARGGIPLRIVDDQASSPTYSPDLSARLWLLAKEKETGIFHCTGDGFCSRYAFAKEILTRAELPLKITPCTSKEFAAPAKRPSFSALANTRTPKMRFWKDALADFMENVAKGMAII